MLAAQHMLLLHCPWIPVARILPLVDGKRCGWGRRAALPSVPSSAVLLPFMAPVLTPAGGRVRPPAAEVHRRLPVVAHRDTQDEHRHNLRLHEPPGSVVPGARVPVVVPEDPVHAVVEEIVGINPGSIVDGVARHPDKFRVQRQVDPDAHVGQPDADAHLGGGRRHRAEQQTERNESVAYILHVVLHFEACAFFIPCAIN